MASLFSRIIAGEIPSYRIAEDDLFFAFLDINPLAPGHTLVVPKQETDYLFDMPEDQLSGILPFSRRIAKALEAVVPCERIGVTVIGLEVPHAHVHLIPIRGIHDMDFSKPKVNLAPERMEALAAEIRAAMAD
jgi:histidine triad (HIT) family protein